MINQSNPVVYVTLGQCKTIWPMLSSALGDYIEIMGHIHAPEKFDDAFVKNEVGRIWHEFLKHDLSRADVVRINFIIRADKAGTGLVKLREATERYFQKLYPAGVITDVYCLLDDANLLNDSDNRMEVLEMLRDEHGKGLIVYLLSNLTSGNSFIGNEDICRTIALLSLFKDCVPDIYVTGADASRYNEFFFLENCAMRHGVFLTAGSLVLAVPNDALKALFMTELLAFGMDIPLEEKPAELADGTYGILPSPPEIPKRPVKSMDYLYGLAIPEVNRADSMPRRQWILRLFGERLEQLIEESNTDAIALESPALDLKGLGDLKVNLFDLLRHTKEGGYYEQAAAEVIKDAELDLASAEDALVRWLDGTPKFSKGSPEASTRRLSPLMVQNLWPYVLAAEYLRRQVNLQHMSDKVGVLVKHKLLVGKLHKALQSYMEEVHKAIVSYQERIQPLNDAFAAFTPSAADYFRERFKEYAARHHNELLDLTKEMTGFLHRGKIRKYLDRLEGYIESNIIPAQAKPVMDLLYEFTSSGVSVSEALSEWVLQCRHMNIRLKTGSSGVYMETNLFMPDIHGEILAADVKKQYEELALGRMNLFAKADADRVAVLYHSGAFSPEDLYYGYFGE